MHQHPRKYLEHRALQVGGRLAQVVGGEVDAVEELLHVDVYHFLPAAADGAPGGAGGLGVPAGVVGNAAQQEYVAGIAPIFYSKATDAEIDVVWAEFNALAA